MIIHQMGMVAVVGDARIIPNAVPYRRDSSDSPHVYFLDFGFILGCTLYSALMFRELFYYILLLSLNAL